MHAPIHLIRNENELTATTYFEFLPGPYQGKCWNPTSVFLDEEVFGYLEPLIEQHIPNFDHYAFVTAPKEPWRHAIAALHELADQLDHAPSFKSIEHHLGFFFINSAENFSIDFPTNARALATLSRDLASWLDSQLSQHDTISILGL